MTIAIERGSLGNFMTAWPSPCGMNPAKSQVKLERETFTKILPARLTLQVLSPFHCNSTEWAEGKGNSTWKNMKNHLVINFFVFNLGASRYLYIGVLYSLSFGFTEIMAHKSLPHVQPPAEILKISYKWQTSQTGAHEKLGWFTMKDTAEWRANHVSYRMRGSGPSV